MNRDADSMGDGRPARGLVPSIRTSIAALVLGVLGASGCMAGYSTRGALIDRAEHDLHCHYLQLQVEELGAGAWRAVGCGRSAEYICARGGGAVTCVRGRDCVDPSTLQTHRRRRRRARRARAERLAAAQVVRPSDVAVRELIVRLEPAIRACVDHGPVGIRVDYGADGSLVGAVRGAAPDSPEAACVRTLIASERIRPPGVTGTVIHVLR